MLTTLNINCIQNKTIKSNTGKSKIKNISIQPARLTNPKISIKSPINISERSSQVSNMNDPADGDWITQKSKRILSSSSSDTSHLKSTLPLIKKLFKTRNRFETLNQNQNVTSEIDNG